ncbi:MAG: DUF2723 domain-containing protein [Candidatus Roizmanbacteria bacterium]|nr:DUF2723 domain-containing protein [Candidatus Roizmanbacteria bacterium]
MVAAAFLNTTAHPPGFPLYTLFLKVFFLLPFGSIALRASLVSLVFALGTVFMTYRLTHTTLVSIFPSGKKMAVIAFFSCLAVFSSFTYLLYANVQEVYMLTLFFLSAISYYLLRIYQHENTHDHRLFWFFSIMGIFHHYILVLSLGIYMVLFWKKRKTILQFVKKHVVMLGSFILLGLAPYLIWFLMTHADPRLYWEEHTWWGLIRNILRLQYGIVNTGAGFQSVVSKLGNVSVYWQHLWLHYSALLLLFIPAGIYLWHHEKRIGAFYLFNFMVYGPLLAFYIDANLRLNNALGIIERYYLFSYIFIPAIIAIGYCAVESFITHIQYLRSSLARTLLIRGLFVVIMIITPLLLLFRSSAALATLLKTPVFEDHARTLLSMVPKQAVVIMTGDVDLFPMQYVRYVLGYRSDVTLLPSGPMDLKGYADTLTQLPELQYEPKATDSAWFADFVQTMLKQDKPVLTNIQSPPDGFSYRQYLAYISILPKEDEGKLLIEAVPASRVSELNLPLVNEQTMVGRKYPFYFYRVIQERYARALFDLGEAHFARDDFASTAYILSRAYQMNRIDDDIVSLYALSLIKIDQCDDAETVLLNYYEDSKATKAAFALSRLYATCLKNPERFSYWNEVYEKALQTETP